MRTFSLPYGKMELKLKTPADGFVGTYMPIHETPEATATSIIAAALDDPIDAQCIENQVRPGQKVAIVASDLTRPCPNELILPPLIDRLLAAGIAGSDITVVIALGLHRKMSEAELESAVGRYVYEKVNVINHSIDDIIRVGVTRRNTPVEINRTVVEADIRICTGNVEFHYFAGFSGGAKAILPGTASEATVRANHGHMIAAEATAASLENNPVRQDLEEGVQMLGVHFLLNVIVNEKHQVLAAAAGHIKGAHRKLCRQLSVSGIARIPHPIDVAIVSAGGSPKDLNLYQAQKALDNIAGVVRAGGVLLLLAECPEGFGSQTFQQWLTTGQSNEELLSRIQQDFVLGGHKAAAIAQVAQKIKIILVTNEAMAQHKILGMDLFSSPQKAVKHAFDTAGPASTYAVFPLGSSTLAKTK